MSIYIILAVCLFLLFFFFFFSSRRRHTRLVSDWSSDVCSSDLKARRLRLRSRHPGEALPAGARDRERYGSCRQEHGAKRSEERRVGKECRSRWRREI